MEKRLRKIFGRILKYLRRMFETPEQPIPEEPTLGTVEKVMSEQEKSILSIDLSNERAGFWVYCVSCNVLHELKNVCFDCGMPICEDTSNCSESIDEPDLGRSVLLCSRCAAERAGN